MREQDIQTRVGSYIHQHTLISDNDTVVVAVSGGADSLCLLHILHTLAQDLGCRLHVAHLDHGLRNTSDDDARFVAASAATLGLPCTIKRHDIRSHKRHISREAVAREVRYAFLRDVARTVGAKSIATGHTRDDQAETLLLHLTRGSGLNGLAGMLPQRGDIIRPLLELDRRDTEAYCAALHITPREDESNRSTAFSRNRLRLEILPKLNAIQPSASANIARAARLLSADLALIERWAAQGLKRSVHTASGQAKVDITEWDHQEAELRPHMLRLLLQQLLGSADGFGESDYGRMLRALEPDTKDTTLALPKGLVITRHGMVALLGPPAAALPPLRTYKLCIPGSVQTEAGDISARRNTAPLVWSDLDAHTAYICPEAAGDELIVRAWKAGDRIRPLGVDGTRKVQDIFVDSKIPRVKRHRVPIIDGPHGIAWIAGICVGEAYRVSLGASAICLVWEEDERGDL